MSQKTLPQIFWEKLTAPLSAVDDIGLALGVVGGITAQAVRLGLEIKAADQAATQVDNLYAVNGAIPAVAYGTSDAGATGFFRDTAAAAGSYSAGELAGLGAGALLAAAGAPAEIVGAAVVAASVGAAFVISRTITAGVDSFNTWMSQAESSGQPITNTTVDGSFVTTNPDGSWSLSATNAVYSYDKDNNPVAVVDKATGDVVSYDSSTGSVSGVSASTGFSVSAQLNVDANGQVAVVDPTTGGSLGAWSVNPLGDLQISYSGGQLVLPADGGLSAASVTSFNADGSASTTTFANDGSVTTVLINAAGDGVGTAINTPSSGGDGQSTTVFRDGQGNLLGYETLSTTNNGTDSATTLISQYGQSGLFLGTTSSEINADGSSTVSSENATGNLIASDVTAPDGSTVQTTYNSLSDPNLISTVSTDANGNVSGTSSTVAGDTPGSYVSTTSDFGASGALIEKDTQTTDVSGTSDYQAYYEGGLLSSSSDIAADGSRTETQYEDPGDPNITQSSHFDENGDLVWQSSTQIIESNGAYLTTTTNPSGQTLSTLVELMDGSTTQTTFNDPSDANLKTVIEDDAQGNLVGVSTTTVGTDSDYLTVRQNGDGETTGTDKTTITYDDQGQQIESTQSYDANGVPTGSNDEVTSPDGNVSATIDGTGVYANLNNATITLSGTNDAITGSGDVISASNAVLTISNSLGGVDDVIIGDHNTIASDFSAITLNGAGEVVSGQSDTLSFGANSSATVDSYGDTITLEAGVNLVADGTGAIINAGADDTLVIATDPDFAYLYYNDGNSTTDMLNVSGDQNITLDSGASVNVVGSGNAITTEGDDILTASNNTVNVLGTDDWIIGSDNEIAASNAKLWISDGGADNVITGDNNTVAANDSSLTLNGSDEFFGNNEAITVAEGQDTTNSSGIVQGDSDEIALLSDNSSVAVQGDFDQIALSSDDSSIDVQGGQDDIAISGAGDTAIAQFRREQLDALNQAQQQLTQDQGDETKSQQRQRQTHLTAPVGGTVQELAVHTIGGVVTPAQALLVLVPDDAGLEIEAQILNRDIGFVRPGQDAEIKLDAFPYTHYGTIAGKVLSISQDAVKDDKLGLIYPVRIQLSRHVIVADGKDIQLEPGMSSSVEIKTEQRRIIEYLLTPLLKYQSEALRER
jgi:hypothetical protein